jgi:GGDEF domain-containing protein
MIVNTMREISRPEDFLGHLSGTDFILVLPPSNLTALSEKLRIRLEQSVEYFYPIKDREQMTKSQNRLGVKLAEIATLKGNFTEANQVKAELVRLKK